MQTTHQSNETGSHATEVALAIALFALVAIFGFSVFGVSLADFFATLGDSSTQAGEMVPEFGINPLSN